MWSWDITYLPTTVRGIWLYLYLVIDVWSRKVVAWDVDEREDPAIAADLVSRACLNELKDQAKAYHLYFCIGKYQQDRQDPAAADWFCKANQSRSAQLEGI